MKAQLTRRMAVPSLLLCLLVAGGIAVAVWSGSGSGTGSGSTGTALDVTITPGVPAAQLFPAGQADVKLTITNPNTFAVHLESLSLDASQATNGYAVDGAHSGCVLSTLGFTTQTNGGNGWTVPAKVGATNGTLPLTLTGALSMGTTAVNACQGATFTVYVQDGA